MRKNSTNIFIGLISLWLIFSGCRKESTETAAQAKSTTSDLLSPDDSRNAKCRVTYIDWTYYVWKFYYNDKGFADRWIIDDGNGLYQDYRIKYDKLGRMSEAPGYDAQGNLLFTNSFTYEGHRVVKQNYSDVLNGINGKILFSYNSKGEIIKEEDAKNGVSVLMYYDKFGNMTRADLYSAGILYYSDAYTFKKPVLNPCLTIAGIDFGFPFYGLGKWNNLWFTSNRTVLYDGGDSVIFNDYDPAKTKFETGFLHFPFSADYYDNVIQDHLLYNFKYGRCDNNDLADSESYPFNNNSLIAKANKTFKGGLIFIGSAKSIKGQMQLKKQYNK